LVLIPYNIQRKLGIKKGSIVLIKPIIHQESFEEPIKNKSPGENIVEVIPEQLFRSESHFLPDSASCQLIVKDPSGLDGFRGSNIVRFDKALALRWEELYGEQKIDEVVISDTVFGKTEQFKFKIERDPKFEGKGLIQMPRSLQKALEVKEGSLVIVKPVLK
jgi:bifunctional DNA-binding transcriptional regulator/antitoxin component of YhaV-PrlF toxin-antitoxin module